MWFKRIGLFLVTNILIMTTISIVTSLLGVNHYLTAQGINLPALLAFCLIYGMGASFISLALSKTIAKWTMGVKIIDMNGPYQDLYLTVKRICTAAKIPMPEVGIYESNEINAFATGPTKKRSLVAVSTGLLNRMSREEVEGVLAHEITHISNGDMVTMTLIVGLVNAFSMFLSRIIAFAVSRLADEKMEYIVRIVVTIVLDIVFSILGSIVVSYFSRIREFKADKGSAKLVGREKMIAALESLKRGMNIPEDERGPALASMKISSKKKISLFASHPSLDDRIEALRKGNF